MIVGDCDDLLDVDKVLNFIHVCRLGPVLFIWEEVVHLIVHYFNQLIIANYIIIKVNKHF